MTKKKNLFCIKPWIRKDRIGEGNTYLFFVLSFLFTFFEYLTDLGGGLVWLRVKKNMRGTDNWVHLGWKLGGRAGFPFFFCSGFLGFVAPCLLDQIPFFLSHGYWLYR